MKRLYWIVALAALLGGCATMPTDYMTTNPSATTGTHVRFMRGLGGAALSPGVDEMGAAAAKIPGVTKVEVYDYTQAQQLANAINAEPASVKEVISGYSCGANATPDAGGGTNHVIDMEAVIQASDWCGAYPITKNVKRAQETYNPNWSATFGLGAYLLQPGAGFPPGNLTVIERPDCHPCADVDPDAQNDIYSAIRSVTNASFSKRLHRLGSSAGHVRHIVRYHDQTP